MGERWRSWLAAASGGWAAVVAGGYAWRPAALAALTIWPLAGWVILGLLPLALLWPRPQRRTGLWLAAVWLLLAGVLADHPAALLRRAPGFPADNFRVVTINCAGGDPTVAANALATAPDLVLLQESPGRADLEPLVTAAYGGAGSVAWGPDATVVARGAVRLVAANVNATLAAVTPPGGAPYLACSLRLQPVPFDLRLYRPATWRLLAAHCTAQVAQVQAVLALAGPRPPSGLILGGDFNAPAGDAVFCALGPGLRDVWSAGAGWGATILSDLPVARIDQIWVAAPWQPVGAVARPVGNSDHRGVLATLRR